MFCSDADYSNHRIVEHRGGQVEAEEDPEYESILKQVVYPPSVFEDEGFEKIVEENVSNIKDKIVERKVYMTVNKELTPNFTYGDLNDIIKQAVVKKGKSCRFNIGFGFILKHNVTNEYRYYYVSTNHYLFQKARTISVMGDIKDIIKTIFDMNIGEHYYMQRPASSWALAGITNVEFKLMYLDVVLG